MTILNKIFKSRKRIRINSSNCNSENECVCPCSEEIENLTKINSKMKIMLREKFERITQLKNELEAIKNPQNVEGDAKDNEDLEKITTYYKSQLEVKNKEIDNLNKKHNEFKLYYEEEIRNLRKKLYSYIEEDNSYITPKRINYDQDNQTTMMVEVLSDSVEKYRLENNNISENITSLIDTIKRVTYNETSFLDNFHKTLVSTKDGMELFKDDVFNSIEQLNSELKPIFKELFNEQENNLIKENKDSNEYNDKLNKTSCTGGIKLTDSIFKKIEENLKHFTYKSSKIEHENDDWLKYTPYSLPMTISNSKHSSYVLVLLKPFLEATTPEERAKYIIYIGESTRLKSRLLQHLRHPRFNSERESKQEIAMVVITSYEISDQSSALLTWIQCLLDEAVINGFRNSFTLREFDVGCGPNPLTNEIKIISNECEIVKKYIKQKLLAALKNPIIISQNEESTSKDATEVLSKYQCHLCPKILNCTSMETLREHLKNIHNLDSKGNTIEVKTYSCHLCPKSYQLKNSLIKHLRYIHSLDSKGNIVDQPKEYSCHLCPNSYRSPSELQRHQRVTHSLIN